MRKNSTRALGALHPILFFMVIYGLSLVLALFVCRTVYYSVNEDPTSRTNKLIQAEPSATLNATAYK